MSATLHQLPNDAIRDVRPGDQDAATQVGAGCRTTLSTAIPSCASDHCGLPGPGRPAGHAVPPQPRSHPEDLVQTARAGLIGAVDRYDPGYGTPFVPYAVACVVSELETLPS